MLAVMAPATPPTSAAGAAIDDATAPLRPRPPLSLVATALASAMALGGVAGRRLAPGRTGIVPRVGRDLATSERKASA